MLPTHKDSVIFRRLEAGAVAYDSAAEVYYGLNEVGATIWELLGEPDVTPEALIDRLASRYPDVDVARLRADTEAIIATLLGYRLLHAPAAASA